MNDRRKILLANNTAMEDFKCPCCNVIVHIGDAIGKNPDGDDCHAQCVKENK